MSSEDQGKKNLDALLQRLTDAQKEFSTFSQEAVDKIFEAVTKCFIKNRVIFAQLAQQETGMGSFEDKVTKNLCTAEGTYYQYKDTKTVGVLEEDLVKGITVYAAPLGVIAALIPVTNPTASTGFKAMLCLKTRNAVCFAPHPRAKKVTALAARLLNEAAVAAGAPPVIGCIEEPTYALSQYLMSHPLIATVIATGGSAMVKAAYSSGNPALGVGPGNAPVVVDYNADLEQFATDVQIGKTFDNGIPCTSESNIIIVEDKSKPERVHEVITHLCKNNGFLLNPEQKAAISKTLFTDTGMPVPNMVGKTAQQVANAAGLSLPESIQFLMAWAVGSPSEEPWLHEKLTPIVSLSRVSCFEDAVKLAEAILNHDGIGHCASLHLDETASETPEKIHLFSTLPISRYVVNMSITLGTATKILNQWTISTMSVGCGSWGRNSYSTALSPLQLLNRKTEMRRRERPQWLRVPSRIYMSNGALKSTLSDDLKGFKKAYIISDKILWSLGTIVQPLVEVLKSLNISFEVFTDVQPDPVFDDLLPALQRMRQIEPDIIVAIGGGSAMDAAKALRLCYEYPNADIDALSENFLNMRMKTAQVCPEGDSPLVKRKTLFVAIPTTSGTGSEVTPFAVITSRIDNRKRVLGDFCFTPDIAVIDPSLVHSMPKALIAATGFDALTHALESYVSIISNPMSDALAIHAARLIFQNLAASYAGDLVARDQVHYASTMAGMAISSSFVGAAHALAHLLGAIFHIPHGIANALVLPEVIKYNACPNPSRVPAFPQYHCPNARAKYAELSVLLGFSSTSDTDECKINKLVEQIRQLINAIGLPSTIKEAKPWIHSDSEFMSKLDELAMGAFLDMSAGTNPRVLIVEEAKKIFLSAFDKTKKEPIAEVQAEKPSLEL